MPRKTAATPLDRDSVRTSFNEAAARCRGKRARPDGAFSRRGRFNEAAARCRGKPAEDSTETIVADALQ